MNLASLQQRFKIPGVTFDDASGLLRLNLHTPQATAAIYLQGAHLTAWQPTGFDPAILLSHKSELAPGRPIRGGIPVVFPWFAGDRKPDRVDGHPGPSHGFARIQEWELASIKPLKDAMQVTLTLGPTAMSRSMGYDHFQLSLVFTIGASLTLALTVANEGPQPISFEQALHTYYEIADIHEAVVSGLEAVSFIDKTDAMKVKPPEGTPIHFTRVTDRVYNNTAGTCVIADVAGRRRLHVEKMGSNSTIVWNPGADLPDLGPWDWHEFVAVETGNVGENSVTLASGSHSTMQLHVVLEHARGET